ATRSGDGVLRASPNAQKILKKSSVVPFTDQFIRRLREVLQLNSFHVLRCVNMIIDPLFFSGLANTLGRGTEIGLVLDGVSIVNFEKSHYKLLSDWILNTKPKVIKVRRCIGFVRDIFNMEFIINFAKLSEQQSISQKGENVKNIFDIPREALKYVCNFERLNMTSLRLNTEWLFELLDMKLHDYGMFNSHWTFLLSKDIRLAQMSMEGMGCDFYHNTEILEVDDNQYEVKSARFSAKASFNIKKKDGQFMLDVEFFDYD
ncbi:hypothetical protein PMAYCL1PPCAC_33119, partial [Pristionchus mayeri]